MEVVLIQLIVRLVGGAGGADGTCGTRDEVMDTFNTYLVLIGRLENSQLEGTIMMDYKNTEQLHHSVG